MTLTTGARQLVVHEAAVTRWSSSAEYRPCSRVVVAGAVSLVAQRLFYYRIMTDTLPRARLSGRSH